MIFNLTFETEFNLFDEPDIVKCYEKGGLIEDANNVRQVEVDFIVRKYILKELLFQASIRSGQHCHWSILTFQWS